jgi:hypothetical protein
MLVNCPSKCLQIGYNHNKSDKKYWQNVGVQGTAFDYKVIVKRGDLVTCSTK